MKIFIFVKSMFLKRNHWSWYANWFHSAENPCSVFSFFLVWWDLFSTTFFHSKFSKIMRVVRMKKRNNKNSGCSTKKASHKTMIKITHKTDRLGCTGHARNVESSLCFLRDGFLLRRLGFSGLGLSSGFLSRGLLGQKCRRNVGQHTTLCNGHSRQQFVQLQMKQERKPLIIVEYDTKWNGQFEVS